MSSWRSDNDLFDGEDARRRFHPGHVEASLFVLGALGLAAALAVGSVYPVVRDYVVETFQEYVCDRYDLPGCVYRGP